MKSSYNEKIHVWGQNLVFAGPGHVYPLPCRGKYLLQGLAQRHIAAQRTYRRGANFLDGKEQSKLLPLRRCSVPAVHTWGLLPGT